MVENVRPLWQAQGRGSRLLATIGGGYARELSSVKLTVKAGLEHFYNRVVLVETDNKVTQAYNNHFVGPLRLVEQHRRGTLVYVLSSTHPTRRSPQTKQGQRASRSSLPPEARSHRHPF